MSDVLLVTIAMICFLTEGFFSGSEIALVSADRTQLRADAKKGRVSSILAMKMLAQPGKTLGMCLIGTNVSTITAATVGAVLVARHTNAPEVVAALFVVPFTLTLGEMLPKALYQHHANRVVHIIVFPLRAISLVFSPVLWVLARITRLAGGDELHRPGVTREEIRLLLDGPSGPSISEADRDLIQRVFDFGESVVEEAMVPLIEVEGISHEESVVEAVTRMTKTGHSRLPVFRDRVDDIIGVVLHHDLLAAGDWQVPVTTVMRPALYIPETKPVDDLLKELRRKRQRMAVVVDEYGGASGIITVEDLLEEIVGDIQDESDYAHPMIRRSGDGEWRADGKAEREHVQDSSGLELPEGDFETVAGYILARMGRIPRVGEQLDLGDYVLQVGKATDRAILEVVIRQKR